MRPISRMLQWGLLCVVMLGGQWCWGAESNKNLANLLSDLSLATGPEYFSLKTRLMAADPEGTWLKARLADKHRSAGERLAVNAVLDEANDQARWKERTAWFCTLLTPDWGMEHVLPKSHRMLYDTNPKSLEAESEAARTLKQVQDCSRGFLYEILLKHSADTLARITADARVAEADRKGKRSFRDAEELLQRTHQGERTTMLRQARSLAARALVLDGGEEAVAILEMALELDYAQKARIREATESLQRIGTPSAVHALSRMSREPPPKVSLHIDQVLSQLVETSTAKDGTVVVSLLGPNYLRVDDRFVIYRVTEADHASEGKLLAVKNGDRVGYRGTKTVAYLRVLAVGKKELHCEEFPGPR